MRNEEWCSERLSNSSRATQHAGYSWPAPRPIHCPALCPGRSASVVRSSCICFPSLSDGSALGGTCKGRRKERLACLCPCSLWGASWAEDVRPAFLSSGLPSQGYGSYPVRAVPFSFSTSGGRNGVGSSPLLLVSGHFRTRWRSHSAPLHKVPSRPAHGPFEHASPTSNRTLLTSRAGIWPWIGLIEKPGLLIMMLHCVVGDLSHKRQVHNHSWKKNKTKSGHERSSSAFINVPDSWVQSVQLESPVMQFLFEEINGW